MMKDYIYERVSFNVSWVKRFTDAEAFANSKCNRSLWKNVTEEIRRARLIEVWTIVNMI